MLILPFFIIKHMKSRTEPVSPYSGGSFRQRGSRYAAQKCTVPSPRAPELPHPFLLSHHILTCFLHPPLALQYVIKYVRDHPDNKNYGWAMAAMLTNTHFSRVLLEKTRFTLSRGYLPVSASARCPVHVDTGAPCCPEATTRCPQEPSSVSS